ncbi:MAG: dihydroxyacetone kinase subunit DhaK [Lachnospiraceae bacterium]|nr:dihydroxyacetone kinase subunit DhaK [Lachnospiraceae bacterium]
MKKFINLPENCENEMIQGLVKAFPGYVKKLDCGNVIVRSEKKRNKVALISGGGSGHEPAHAGYVGTGMLDCAVPGAVFTSPTPDQIYEGIKAIATPEGVLMIIKNYTGDIMNFEMAQEMAEMDDIKVAGVVVDDDVAVQNSTWTTGRRGVAGTIFVHKIAGAMAETGASLEEVERVAKETIANVRTMGVALTPCTVPAAGTPGFSIGEDELEMGIGIHGEPGVNRQKMKPVNEIIDELLDHILADLDFAGSEVAVMLNSSGGTPLMELYIAYDHLADVLAENNVKVYRSYVGEYMTSLEMQGLSVTLLRLNDERKALLNAAADTIAFKEFGGRS